jgi:hypothetical protein
MVLSFPPSPKSDTPLPPLEEEKLFSKVKRRRGLEREKKAARFFWRPFVKNIPDHAGFFFFSYFWLMMTYGQIVTRGRKKKQHWREREREKL